MLRSCARRRVREPHPRRAFTVGLGTVRAAHYSGATPAATDAELGRKPIVTHHPTEVLRGHAPHRDAEAHGAGCSACPAVSGSHERALACPTDGWVDPWPP